MGDMKLPVNDKRLILLFLKFSLIYRDLKDLEYERLFYVFT